MCAGKRTSSRFSRKPPRMSCVPARIVAAQQAMAAAVASAANALAEQTPNSPGLPAEQKEATSPCALAGAASEAVARESVQTTPPPLAATGKIQAMSPSGLDSQSQIRNAKQLIEQYKLPGGPRFLPPSLVGFDVANRDGIPMDGTRCDCLLGDIASMGWDLEEANFGNICVEERPDQHEVFEYNLRACGEGEFLAPLDCERLPYGSLSHSHLHQCLKNIAGRAVAKAPEAFVVAGRLCPETISRLQPDLAESVRTGLQWTILSWRIRDVPGARELIQAAMNRKAGVHMKELRSFPGKGYGLKTGTELTHLYGREGVRSLVPSRCRKRFVA